MKKITMRLIALALLTLVSMGAAAQTKIVQIANDGKFDGGTIEVTRQEEQKEGGVKVTITVSPNSGYTIKKEAIKVYATYPPSGSRADTRDIEIASSLTLLYNGSEKEDVKDASAKRDYTFTVPSGFGAWIKEAKFQPDESKGGDEPSRSVLDYSGTYYIASLGYNAANSTTNYYLCPTEGWAFYVADNSVTGEDNGKPFLTTYQCRSSAYHNGNSSDALWTIEKASAPNSDYYYIKQKSTGRYLVSNGAMSNNPDRARVHLEEINDPNNLDDKALFSIYIPNKKSYYVIQPKGITDETSTVHNGHDTHKWLSVNQGNKNNLAGTNARTDGPSGFENTGGIICIYTEADANAPFYLEIPSPVISRDPSSLKISISCEFDDVIIRYTTDGKEPTKDSTPYEGEFLPGIGTSAVKAKAFNSSGDVASATTTFELPKNAAPSISVNMSTMQATISTSVEGGTIYYTTNGSNPTVSSSVYSAPITFNKPTIIKAIVGKVGFAPSTVTIKDIIKVEAPQFYDNGNLTIAITSATAGASIYYTTDGSTPSKSSSQYTAPLADMEGKTIKAIALKKDCFNSDVATFGPVSFSCAQPLIRRTGLNQFTLTCPNPTSGVAIYYTINGNAPSTSDSHVGSGEPVTFEASQLPLTVKAIAVAEGYSNSPEATLTILDGEMSGSGTSSDPYQIAIDSDFPRFVTKVNGTEASASFIVTNDINASGATEITTPFTGTFDGGCYTISDLGHALFNSVSGGTVKNVILDNVGISGGTNAGAIANKVMGTSNSIGSIYNCGVLSGSVGGSGYVGSIVGQLGDSSNDNCYARVINCFSYATVSGGSDVGGIVGYNDFASTAGNIRTMVMNCMFYGDIKSGTNVSPVYGGDIIDNLQGGLNNFNYYAYSQLKTATINKYNCALAVEDNYLNRFEFYRLLLNSNKKLAAFYATGSPNNAGQMAKWVLETADRTINDPKPYPVLKAQGYYPSIINPDFENAPSAESAGRNKGGKLGKTLSVTINGVGSNAPSSASITNGSLTLQRTDKDFDRFNFNYDKVQLPYYNDVGTGNYTDNKVVTGWKITAITAIEGDPYTEANYPTTGVKDFPDHNYADRKSSNKDLYSVSHRVFSQGAYFDVPYGVTSITIEPYWGKAYYIADQYYDVVYKNDYSGKQGVSQTGNQVANTIKFNGQGIETSIERALNNINNNMGGLGSTVYDNALVLVGNLHLDVVPLNGDRPFTMMSVDTDNDHEPDYSLIYHHKSRLNITPIRFDFLNIPGTAQAQKPNGANLICNFTIFKTRGWFEITNTALVHSDQLEYENADLGSGVTKIDAPLILLGGDFDQFVSTQSSEVAGHTIYIHVGSNVRIHEFGLGTHSDGSKSTPHVPVSVTGGEFPGFYLTGTYNANAAVREDNAECYISGGYIHEAAGASLEQINGNVRWQIYNADIDNFFGGGINEAKPITGDIITDIYNSHVILFCGGPKFGNMQANKTVTTNAEGCTFGKFFGAGYGGTSITKKKYYDNTSPAWGTTLQGYYTTDRGLYFDGKTTNAVDAKYGKKGLGVATDFDYEFFVWSSGSTGGRFFVKFAAFSLAQCNDVSSTLKKCTVNENFYGGGNLGKVVGTATSVLEDCTVKGSVYGAGYSASLPTVEVRDAGFTKVPNYNKNSGMFEPAEFSGTTTFTWQNAAEAGVTLKDKESGSDLTNHILYTNTELTGLGEVAKAVLTINGTTTVAESVYGGGEESGVGGDTKVTVNGGFIGAEGGTSYGYRYGNVYGGGKGKIDNAGNLVVSSVADLDAGLVKGNTSVTINGTKETTKIVHNVYGGGAVGSVGTFTRDANGMPTACAANTGQATVTINGGKIGHNRKDSGMVDGSSRGWEGNAQAEGSFLNQLAWVNNATVIIGALSSEDPEDKGPAILGSVYGGGENGHNFKDSNVTVNKGTIGNADSSADGYECGNVYGAGCGTDTYTVGDDPTEHYNPMAGIVRGNATVTIKGGHVLRNVYGAGSMGSVGNEADAEGASTSGKTTVKITGDAMIGTDDGHGNIYGAARGDLAVQEENLANVRETEVEISGDADIKGSVFGGGEAGIVWENVKVNILGGTIAKDVYGGGALANTQIANSNQGNTTSTFTTLVNLKGGTISGDAYGGGLGRKEVKNESNEVTTTGIAALVKGDVKVELNKDIAIKGVRGCVVNQIFGCNNQNGTPEGNVEVHVYNTQRAGATQIVNDANVTNAKVAGTQDSNGDFELNSFDVAAVYGGGNQADYIPVDGTNQKTYVVIEGCDRTSIGNVYGGGNAAAVPGTHVLIKGSYEIGEVFGGGNGAKEGTRAHVGKYNESEEDYTLGDGKALVQLMAGKVKFVYGGSNTRGNIRGGATVNNVDNEWKEGEGTQADCCENMQVGQIFAGGKNADMASGADVVLGCTNSNDWVEEIYAGARRANVGGDVSLTITSGKFGRVFGGNMISGKLNGSITVNIEENGVCGIPVIIGELYGGGNLAAYSIYGYNDNGTVKTSGDNPHASPVVNVRAFTSIGNIFGGGYGNTAVMVGSPTVNINEAAINHEDKTNEYQGNQFSGTNLYFKKSENSEISVLDLSIKSDPTDMTNIYKVVVPDHTDGKMGAIGNIYGGGNAAEVQGDTHVNIGTDTEVYVVRPDLTVTDKVKGFYTRSWNSATKTYDYTLIVDADKTAEEGVNYYQKRDVAGADIRGNVYGGGNKADVTGSTNVVVGKKSN